MQYIKTYILLLFIIPAALNVTTTAAGKHNTNNAVKNENSIHVSDSGRININLPEGTRMYYVNITDSAGNIVSTNPVVFGEESTPVEMKKRIVFNPDVWLEPKIYEDVPDSLSYPGLKAFYYKGLDYKGKKTKVFAYIGFPANASIDNKVPAVVLVHGGAGTAFPQWVKIWNDSGYAAIAMDLESHQPVAPGGYLSSGNYGGPSNNHYSDIADNITDQWMYHAVADVYLAYSLLANDERVDKNKIGITGISWGAVITSIAIGNADCFAFAVPVYGCGYLNNSKGAMKDDYNGKVAKQWCYSNLAGTVQTPSLWLNSDSDFSFSIDATAKTVKNTRKSTVVILPSYPHSHLDGWMPREIYTFANSIVKGSPGLIKITKHPGETDASFGCSTSNSFGFKSAELIYSKEPITYDSKSKFISKWLLQPLDVTGINKP